MWMTGPSPMSPSGRVWNLERPQPGAGRVSLDVTRLIGARQGEETP